MFHNEAGCLELAFKSIGLEIETEIETETIEDVHIEPSLIENRMRLLQLLSKRDSSAQGAKDLERMMAQFDPNGS